MKPIEKSRIAIIIPAFNEGDRLKRVVRDVLTHGYTRIVVVDDCSTDESIRSLKGEPVVLLRHVVNRGAGAATETGLEYVRQFMDFDAVITMDGDTQHDAADLDGMLTIHFEQDADVTIGNRFSGSENNIPSTTRFYNGVANVTTSLISGKKVLDSQSGFKALSRQAVFQIELKQDRFAHCSEIIIKAHKLGLRVAYAPIAVYYPEEIRNKGQNLATGITTFVNLLQAVLFKNHQ